jgi:hypothetical protein
VATLGSTSPIPNPRAATQLSRSVVCPVVASRPWTLPIAARSRHQDVSLAHHQQTQLQPATRLIYAADLKERNMQDDLRLIKPRSRAACSECGLKPCPEYMYGCIANPCSHKSKLYLQGHELLRSRTTILHINASARIHRISLPSFAASRHPRDAVISRHSDAITGPPFLTSRASSEHSVTSPRRTSSLPLR